MKLTNRFLVVVNPASGGGRSETMLSGLLASGNDGVAKLSARLEAGEPSSWPVVRTTKDDSWKLEAETQIRSGHINSMIVIGGDGTIMEAASFLYQLKRDGVVGVTNAATPGIVPLPGGRGNDFIRGLYGYSLDDGDFWAWLSQKQWTSKFLDFGSANGKLFLNMASVGYGGEVVEKAQSRKALWSGTSMVYQVEGVLGMLEAASCRCEVKADGNVVYNGDFFGAFVGNGKANGGGLFWTPLASIDDGKLDAIMFAKPGLLAMASSLSAIKKRKPATFKNSTAQASEFVFHFDKPAALELDGEYCGRALTHEFKSLPQALRAWIPES